MYTACVAGKSKHIGLQSVEKTPNPEHTNAVKKGDLQPGVCVSTDQYECRVKGGLPCIKGKEDPHIMYCGGTLFIDHVSGHVSVLNQLSLGAADTVRSKEIYEEQEADMGISIKQYYGDNGVYTSKVFTENLEKRHQTMSYSRGGAHV